MVKVQPHKLVPLLMVQQAAAAVEFYKQGLGAEEAGRLPLNQDQAQVQVELRIGSAVFYVCDLREDTPQPNGSSVRRVPASVTLHLEVDDCDAAVARAAAAGAEVLMPPADTTWGDRYARIRDPFGHQWSFAHSTSRPGRSAA
ncbi:MAG: VOC family protein [Gemmataceae bacterium]|nr:VOC family protein [Gemmataceae bacterium]MCS7271500.1 VOC family protein [Gemmataceae bacterium]MDW8242722.1 VOC family protein [Thermogemmata sp.]